MTAWQRFEFSDDAIATFARDTECLFHRSRRDSGDPMPPGLSAKTLIAHGMELAFVAHVGYQLKTVTLGEALNVVVDTAVQSLFGEWRQTPPRPPRPRGEEVPPYPLSPLSRISGQRLKSNERRGLRLSS